MVADIAFPKQIVQNKPLSLLGHGESILYFSSILLRYDIFDIYFNN